MHIVLFEPEIPQNAGNIARTCAATKSELHLIRPLGFSLENKYLERAGLDYWKLVKIHIHDSYDDFVKEYEKVNCIYATTKGKRCYTEINYKKDDFLVFGPETRGLPLSLLEKNWPKTIRIPMQKEARSLNLSNSVAIIVYEALRQQGFPGLLL